MFAVPGKGNELGDGFPVAENSVQFVGRESFSYRPLHGDVVVGRAEPEVHARGGGWPFITNHCANEILGHGAVMERTLFRCISSPFQELR